MKYLVEILVGGKPFRLTIDAKDEAEAKYLALGKIKFTKCEPVVTDENMLNHLKNIFGI